MKLLHSFLAEGKNFLARFQREAKSAAQLRHPNTVQTYDFDVTDGVYFYIVMEYINGYTLDAKLQELTAQNEIMPLPEAIRISLPPYSLSLPAATSTFPVRVTILPSVLQVDVPSLDFGQVGLGEAAQTTFTLTNKGRGLLMGRIRCRVSWLTASPEQFQVRAGESLHLVVQADSQTLVPGDVTHDWALMVESNGGHAILGVRIKVLSPHLKLDPAPIDLGALDLIQPGAGKKAELMVRNGAGLEY